MNSFVNRRVLGIEPSGIRDFFDIVMQKKDVISLGIGEPGIKTPWEIRKKAISCLEKGITSYTENAGLFDLRVAISDFLEEKYNLVYSPKNEIMVTTAGSEAVDLAIRAVIERGDEVLIPSPSYVMYEPLCQISFASVRGYNIYAPDIGAEIEKNITDKTKMLILNYPNNPTGISFFRDELESIAKVLRNKNIIVVSDEIYSELTYDGKKHISFASIDGMWGKTITINGFSKFFAMTGFRLGYACGPVSVIAGMLKIHQYSMLCAPSISQYAGITALENHEEIIEKIRSLFERQRNFFVSEMKDANIVCRKPQGTLYAFLDITKYGKTSKDFCLDLLEKENLAVVPGSAFGKNGEGFIRVNYSVKKEVLEEATKRLKRYCCSLV